MNQLNSLAYIHSFVTLFCDLGYWHSSRRRRGYPTLWCQDSQLITHHSSLICSFGQNGPEIWINRQATSRAKRPLPIFSLGGYWVIRPRIFTTRLASRFRPQQEHVFEVSRLLLQSMRISFSRCCIRANSHPWSYLSPHLLRFHESLFSFLRILLKVSMAMCRPCGQCTV